MTIDKSLKRKGRLARTRNVLKRAERVVVLKEEDRFTEGQSPIGLPKVRVVRSAVGKKKKKEKKEEEGAAAAGKGAAPAKGGGKK
ncbi:MAG: small basic protein [Planctomycetaceae bacterium]|nr:small basic protein [Planctomycetaceae bacterium]